MGIGRIGHREILAYLSAGGVRGLGYHAAMARETTRLREIEAGDVTLTWFPAERPQQAVGFTTAARGAVMVLPGGGYAHLAEHEGAPVAERLAEAGFDAAVLRYRLGNAGHRHPAMVQDAVLGLQKMCERFGGAGKVRTGVLGFSAGGHLASSLLVHGRRFAETQDKPCQPDAAVLCYPVIDLQGETLVHQGSREQLLGPDPSAELKRLMSTHLHVDERSPPTFLWHTADDGPVPVAHSLRFAKACRAAGVATESHIYESGPHGLGLAEGTMAEGWFDLAVQFLHRHLRDGGQA